MTAKTCRALNENQILRLKSICASSRYPQRDLTMIELGIGGCLRINEIVSLTIGQVYNADGSVKSSFILTAEQSKNSEEGRVYLTKKAVKALERYRLTLTSTNSSNPLFPSQRTGKCMTSNYGTQLIRKLMDRAGLPKDLGSHSFRKTFITHSIKKHGLSIPIAQKLLRHKHYSTTMKYVDLLGCDIEDVVAGLSV